MTVNNFAGNKIDSEGVEALDRLLAQLSKVEVVDLGGEHNHVTALTAS